jgi:hypothetical protein
LSENTGHLGGRPGRLCTQMGLRPCTGALEMLIRSRRPEALTGRDRRQDWHRPMASATLRR